MFKATYDPKWKKALLAAVITLLIGIALVFTPEPFNAIGFILVFVGPIICLCVVISVLFNNLLIKRRYDYAEKKIIPNCPDLNLVKEALQNGSAQVFDNEMTIVIPDGVFSVVNDTADMYFFKDINKIYATNQFEDRYVPKMQFIKFEMNKGNYYIAITEKKKVKESYELCVKACQNGLNNYKLAHGDSETATEE